MRCDYEQCVEESISETFITPIGTTLHRKCFELYWYGQTLEPDPFPYESNRGSRHAFPGTLNQKPLILKPREGYTQDLKIYEVD